SVKIIAIEDQEALGMHLSPAAAKGVASAFWLLLADGGPVANMPLLFQIGFNLLRQVVDHHDCAIHFRRQGAEDPIEYRPVLHGQQRFGSGERVGPKSRAQASGQQYGVHEWSSAACGLAGLPLLARPHAAVRFPTHYVDPRKDVKWGSGG